MELEIAVEEPWPGTACWETLARRVAEATARLAPELANTRLSASLLFTDDAEVRDLNRQWRGKDKPTNVLSFPMLGRDELLGLTAEGPPEMLGDIALAHDTCAREAAEKGVSIQDHAAHLIVHGLLHLAGHDHEVSASEAAAMEAIEIKALARLGIADPYGDHAQRQGA